MIAKTISAGFSNRLNSYMYRYLSIARHVRLYLHFQPSSPTQPIRTGYCLKRFLRHAADATFMTNAWHLAYVFRVAFGQSQQQLQQQVAQITRSFLAAWAAANGH